MFSGVSRQVSYCWKDHLQRVDVCEAIGRQPVDRLRGDDRPVSVEEGIARFVAWFRDDEERLV